MSRNLKYVTLIALVAGSDRGRRAARRAQPPSRHETPSARPSRGTEALAKRCCLLERAGSRTSPSQRAVCDLEAMAATTAAVAASTFWAHSFGSYYASPYIGFGYDAAAAEQTETAPEAAPRRRIKGLLRLELTRAGPDWSITSTAVDRLVGDIRLTNRGQRRRATN